FFLQHHHASRWSARGAQKQISDIRKQAKHRGKLSKKVYRLINRHSKLMEFYQNLEDSFNLCILIELVTVTIVLAFIEFSSCKLILIESLVLTYAGDFLQREIKKIAYSAYDNQWYDFKVKIMKNLPMVMFRRMIPHQITTGKCLPMNLFSFKEILKATGSYLFVLRVKIKK
ncbi:Odorant receptor 382, partial [Nylanderia fulva]